MPYHLIICNETFIFIENIEEILTHCLHAPAKTRVYNDEIFRPRKLKIGGIFNAIAVTCSVVLVKCRMGAGIATTSFSEFRDTILLAELIDL